jgi:hypothetical protein
LRMKLKMPKKERQENLIECETCGHACHRGKDCPVCANDVCFICKCPNCQDVPK